MLFRRSSFAVGFAAGCIAALVISTATVVRAETMDLATQIDAVTVYPRGAQVVRVGRIELPSGTHTLRLPDLPRDVIEETFRVEGTSTGRLEIGTVDLKTITLTREEADTAAAERQAIEDEIERLERELEKLGYDIQVKETQQEFLTNLAGLPGRGPILLQAAKEGAGAVNWAEIYQLIGTNMAEVQDGIFRLRQTLRDTEKAIEDARKRLARLAPKPERRLVGDITVIAEGAQEAELTVRYQVRSGSWEPIYDARLETNLGAEGASVLELTRRAAIRQASGEPWNNVTLALSTARPQGSTAAPDLEPLIVDFRPKPPPRPEPVAEAMQQENKADAPRLGVRSRGLASAQPQDGAASSAAMFAVTDREATVEAAPFQATFAVPDRTTIANDGTIKQVKIDTQTFEPELIVRTVPRIDPRAYLYAKLKLPGETPYLPGTVTLFRDGTFVGRGSLPALTGGQEHELGFGVDDRVEVTFAVAEEVRSETGTFTSSRVDQKRYKVSVMNHHAREVIVTVLDHIPVSRDKEIKVELQATLQPTTRDVEDKRGVLAWTFPLNSKANKAFEIGYKVSWPAEREIDYR